MIHESCYWKLPLLEAATRLQALTGPGELGEEQLAQIERDLFISFYAIRKLLEAPAKLTDAAHALNVSLTCHPNREPVTHRNNHKIDELYDLDVATPTTLPIRSACNQIIHSFVFTICEREHGGLAGVFFASDRNKNSQLYFLDAAEIVKTFEHIGNDKPVSIKWSCDPRTGKETMEVR
ncbi:hypothetical protein [Dyella nitratireducens]|uniref:Uncharacterized protein n=1 Tax=Dyella nitratireducens TaxID=1849580 RepID=A0ABQ1FMA0_9GAMM|nr:hypothetical protein [Dyella nitratireducens]GGA21939.1 hypothetical protein GCM10010981_07610 [Dyella nitratireducens]GLQ44178.1 hypothetical protein GCM10007902_40280 [Dyella nitratireducens]